MYEHSVPRSTMTETAPSICMLSSTFKRPFIPLSSQQHLPNLHQQDQRQCCLKLGFHKWKCDEVYKHSARSPMRDQCPLPVYPVRDSACQHQLFTSGVVTFTATNVLNYEFQPSKSCHVHLICENDYPRPVHMYIYMVMRSVSAVPKREQRTFPYVIDELAGSRLTRTHLHSKGTVAPVLFGDAR